MECYLHVDPTGLLLDADGDGRFPLIQADDDLRTHDEIASDLGACRTLAGRFGLDRVVSYRRWLRKQDDTARD